MSANSSHTLAKKSQQGYANKKKAGQKVVPQPVIPCGKHVSIAAQEGYYRSQKTGVLRAFTIGSLPVAGKRTLSPTPHFHPEMPPGPKWTLLMESAPFLVVVVAAYLRSLCQRRFELTIRLPAVPSV